MQYDFNKIIQRKNTKSVKWDLNSEVFGDSDVIPMWVADMDFQVAKPIEDAIKKRAEHPVFGYSIIEDSYFEAVVNWMKKRHDWCVDKKWIQFCPGVVPALNYIVRTFTKPGDEVIVQTPVYHPFFSAVKNNGDQLITNPLIYENGGYTMDLKDLERKITNRTKLIIISNPHNPVGRVWSKEELSAIGEISLKHGIIVVSDEIHSDLIYKDYKHTVFASISEELAQNSIICTAPSKTFNLAGLQTSI